MYNKYVSDVKLQLEMRESECKMTKQNVEHDIFVLIVEYLRDK